MNLIELKAKAYDLSMQINQLEQIINQSQEYVDILNFRNELIKVNSEIINYKEPEVEVNDENLQ